MRGVASLRLDASDGDERLILLRSAGSASRRDWRVTVRVRQAHEDVLAARLLTSFCVGDRKQTVPVALGLKYLS
jgi:hypothetical protein